MQHQFSLHVRDLLPVCALSTEEASSLTVSACSGASYFRFNGRMATASKAAQGYSGSVDEEQCRGFTSTPGVLPNPLVDDLKGRHMNKGVLIPLKTTQEVRQDHTVVQAYITRAPTKSANEVIK